MFADPLTRPKIHNGIFGEKNGRYIDGRTPLVYSLRHCKKYEVWRNEVFRRDNFTCQDCGQKGGRLEAHHEEAFISIFNQFIQTSTIWKNRYLERQRARQ